MSTATFRRMRAPRFIDATSLALQRALALAHHCRLAVETTHPRFRFLAAPGVSVVLTVNSGYE